LMGAHHKYSPYTSNMWPFQNWGSHWRSKIWHTCFVYVCHYWVFGSYIYQRTGHGNKYRLLVSSNVTLLAGDNDSNNCYAHVVIQSSSPSSPSHHLILSCWFCNLYPAANYCGKCSKQWIYISVSFLTYFELMV
jgi:hypothetical protein